jgi:imidazolonepropionase-like amidohydrolase
MRDGRITWLGPDAQAPDPKGVKVLDESGNSVMPGLVMLHEHLFTTSAAEGPQEFLQQRGFSFPVLYLAAGVTTIRTAGSIEPYMDLEIKRQIDAGEYPGPRMFLTAPYLDGVPPAYPVLKSNRVAMASEWSLGVGAQGKGEKEARSATWFGMGPDSTA